MQPLRDRLKYEREKRGWSQVYVAQRLGVKRSSTYANWEYGLREPDHDTLARLAELYEVSIDYLLGHTDDSTPYRTIGRGRRDVNEDELPLTDEEVAAIERLKQDPEMEVAFHHLLSAPIKKQRSMLRALKIMAEMDEPEK